MRFTIQNGKHLFTVLGRTESFDSFSQGVHWAFTQKEAMRVATEIWSK
ncbi:Uncharacterised protein [Yersinia frederiksenii]|nr:Uncharacterised protein [Yersinia frederiksenii]HDL6893887.1 hypothetical protein [Yersinia enterocolitica]